MERVEYADVHLQSKSESQGGECSLFEGFIADSYRRVAKVIHPGWQKTLLKGKESKGPRHHSGQ
jgi:hypothetical protein